MFNVNPTLDISFKTQEILFICILNLVSKFQWSLFWPLNIPNGDNDGDDAYDNDDDDDDDDDSDDDDNKIFERVKYNSVYLFLVLGFVIFSDLFESFLTPINHYIFIIFL